jgi:phosphoserine phosphatase RsbU/P
LLCFFTDGLVERRGQVIDQGMNRLAATLGKQIAADPDDAAGTAAEAACAEVMRALIGNASSPDDIAVLMFSRRSSPFRA